MPRLPRVIHPLRVIRKSARLNQPRFARKVGISAALLQAIELDKRRRILDPTLAARIAAMFGAKLGTFESLGRAPLARDGSPYTREAYLMFVQGENVAKGTGFDLVRRKETMVLLDLVLQAAAQKGLFESSQVSFAQWLKNSIDELELMETMERLFQNFEPVEVSLEKQAARPLGVLRHQMEIARRRGQNTGELERRLARSHAADSSSIVETRTLKQLLHSAFQPMLQNRHWKTRSVSANSQARGQTPARRDGVLTSPDLQRARAALAQITSSGRRRP